MRVAIACALWGAIACTLSCARGKTANNIEPSCCVAEGPGADAGQADDSEPDCSRLVEQSETEAQSVAEAQFEEGKRLVESCGEACMKSETGGGDRSQGLSLLRAAADAGHLRAQSFYGLTLFGDLMTSGDEEGFKDQYIEALYFIALSARRGDGDAQESIPQLQTLSISAAGALSAPLEEPLSGLPSVWVKEAVQRAQRDARCFVE